MRRVWRWGVRSGVATALVLAAGGSVAAGALSGAYSGKTSQRQRVSFSVSGGAVRNFAITTLDRCRNGHRIAVHASRFTPMAITHGRFHGTFTPIGGQPGEASTIRGKVKGRKATGSITDTAYDAAHGGLCLGKAHFKARHA
jgi:hypothetical protein